ncbi:sucrose-6-phosphate hydrolase [Lactobacillus sp. ESL0791]|uniref:glycoside hydrolase family 32 protein n=1 Tax=Lactobacillus sp. ESL0791 TaxID=2983234 RepID=UPI0023F8D285|nr:sucrose-6-phosphate hydrolase [Lactobacillus sp. ESL0791]MDF7638143.1 sucrose-6-phosphate hydrolase [Lactobacillus sp. ESL0791]
MGKETTTKSSGITNERYRLNYHVAAPTGWMNDPNGFSYFKGYYHLFYQYYPYSAEWGTMHWGHYRSKDLVHWEELPVALTPGDAEDRDGCYSGGAIVKDNCLYLFYTGQHYYDANNPSRFWQTQNIACSRDGIHFTKYENNPVIAQAPEDNTEHFRDPKVWQHENNYYMVLGSQNKRGLGRALLYRSANLLHWSYLGPIAAADNAEKEGNMWECPDLFNLDGKDILLCSPKGIKATAKEYLNKDETGYFIGSLDYRKNKFTHGSFKELDHGHDFYAAQTMLAPDKRRIVIGWLDMWHAQMPEQADGWAGALTLPRELILKDDHLYMRPVAELKSLRQQEIINEEELISKKQLAVPDSQHLELLLEFFVGNWSGKKISFILKNDNNELVSLTWNNAANEVVLERADKQKEDKKRFGSLKPSAKLKMQIFIDTSSIEIFLNDGEVVFSERYYTEEKPEIIIKTQAEVQTKVQAYMLSHG